ncbi:hypothetical protein Hte_001827 [Hypoxylon texense]
MDSFGRSNSFGEPSSRLFSTSWGRSHEPAQISENSINRIPFFDIIQASDQYKLPFVQLNDLGTRASSLRPPLREIFSLGEGLTSKVIRHQTDDSTNHIVSSGSIVALKVFRPRDHDSASTPSTARHEVYKAIFREIQAYCQPSLRNHPNIAQLLFIGLQQGSPFPVLAIELGQHGSLDFIIREANPGPTPAQKRHITLDIALGLRGVHQAGFIYGDLKPDNVLIMAHPDPCRQLVAKLIDFGGSSKLAGQNPGKPAHFTPLWSAPEVLNEDYDIDWEKADVYSFGLVAASLWTQRDGSLSLDPKGSCFLSLFTGDYSDASIVEPTLLAIKCTPGLCIRFLQTILDRYKVEDMDKSELLDILTPILNPKFWQRPDTESLLELLVGFGATVGRNIQNEDIVMGKQPVQQHPTRQEKPYFSIRDTSWFESELRREVTEFHPTILDRLGKEIIDIPALDLPDDVFIMFLSCATIDLLGTETFRAYGSKKSLINTVELQYYAQLLADLHTSVPGKDRNLETASKWLRVSALCGSKDAMHVVALTSTRTSDESGVPVRLYLSLLALSHSGAALQRIFTCWPELFKKIRGIQQRYLASETVKEVPKELFPFYTLATYSASSLAADPVTSMRRALDVGALAEIEQILEDKISTQDLDEILPSLLHELRHLTDAEAWPLARTAYKRGARLESMVPCESPILDCQPLEGICHPVPASYSPLSAAIWHGKAALALAIFYLHFDAYTPIPDFTTALFLSFRYLQHEMAEILLCLLEENPSMCHDDAHSREIYEAPLDNLLTSTMSCGSSIDLERRAMHGHLFNFEYEKTIQILLEAGADPTQGTGDNCPFFNALVRDDLIGLRLFIRGLKARGHDPIILDLIRNPTRTKGVGNIISSDALVICISNNSIHCFEYLVRLYPELVLEEISESGDTLLHYACRHPPNIDFIRVLLDNGANVVADRGSIDCLNPLFEALSHDNLPAAELIASRCPEDLTTLLSRNTHGMSVFYALFVAWTGMGNVELIESIRWVINHNGSHFYGPNDAAVWGLIFAKPRPTTQSDRTREVQLLELLLDTSLFRDKINEPVFRSGKEPKGFHTNEMTLFHIAAMHGHFEVVELLLARGADLNAVVTGPSIGGGLEKWTALDLVHIFSVMLWPEGIKAAGSLEMRKWQEDMNATMGLLQERLGNRPAMGTRLLKETVAPFLHGYLPSTPVTRMLRKRHHSHGSWPLPLLSTTNGTTQQSLKDERTSDDWMKDIWYDLLTNIPVDNPVRTHGQHIPKLNELNELNGILNGLLSVKDRLKDDETAIRDSGFLLRQTWRLPPECHFLRIRGAVELDYFFSLEEMRILHEKPPLYPSKDEMSTYDPKGKGKETVSSDPSHLYLSMVIPSRASEAGDSVYCRLDHILRSSSHPIDDTEQDAWKSFPEDAMGEILRATIESGSLESLGALASAVEDVERTDFSDLTPLQQAVVHGNVDMVNILVAHGGDVNRVFPEDGLLPLHVCIKKDDRTMAELLLNCGADANGETRDGLPPLHFCLSRDDNPEMIKTLIRGGADIRMVAQNAAPLDMATDYGYRGSLDILQDAIQGAI